MSAQAGWYPDPGGGHDLYRYWDGKAWSAATSPNPAAPPPAQGLVGGASQPGALGGQPLGGQTHAGQTYGGQTYGSQAYGGQAFGQSSAGSAYANYQQVQKKKSPVGWWIAGAALVLVIVVVAVIAIRAVTGGGLTAGVPTGQSSGEVCPKQTTETPSPEPEPNDGRVHGGPVSYPELGDPWQAPTADNRVPYGSSVLTQTVPVEENYQPDQDWVASVLVGELQAGDGFFTPEQGAQIVVKCILGRYYGNNPVNSNVTVNKKVTIDGHEAWQVESKLSFDIKGLKTKGELLIVAVVSAGDTSGLYYASIPDTTPQLVSPARQALKQLTVDR